MTENEERETVVWMGRIEQAVYFMAQNFYTGELAVRVRPSDLVRWYQYVMKQHGYMGGAVSVEDVCQMTVNRGPLSFVLVPDKKAPAGGMMCFEVDKSPHSS